ncbi:MAG: hypothetical protein AB1483_00055 [Candidatus Zixiibacteriota bacterium]
MIVWDEKKQAWFGKIRMIAVAMLVVAPIIYLGMTYVIKAAGQQGGQIEMMFYILLAVAIIEPAMAIFIERFQISSFKASQQSQMTPDNVFFTMSVIKFAFVEMSYLFGLVVYLLSGDRASMLYFYPIGIAWTFVYWPKKSTYESFIQRIESNVPYTG